MAAASQTGGGSRALVNGAALHLDDHAADRGESSSGLPSRAMMSASLLGTMEPISRARSLRLAPVRV